MVELTRHFNFVSPFDPNDPTNNVKPEVRALAEKKIYGNQRLLGEVESFKQIFLTKKECLVHGNLHTGSITVNEGTAKVRLHLRYGTRVSHRVYHCE